MKDKLIGIGELMEMLGCEDERTAIHWCNENNVPIIKMGKSKYTLKIFLELFLKDRIARFVSVHFKNATEILQAIEKEDKLSLSNLLSVPLPQKAEVKYKARANSKAALEYIKKHKAT